MAKAKTTHTPRNRHHEHRKVATGKDNPHDILRTIVGDFGDPGIQAMFSEAVALMAASEKVARAFFDEVEMKGRLEADRGCHVPLFAIKPDRFSFVDMIDPPDEFVQEFRAHSAGRFMFPIKELCGITFGELATVVHHDQDEVLVVLTCLGVALRAVVDQGETQTNMECVYHFMRCLYDLFGKAITANGIANLPRK